LYVELSNGQWLLEIIPHSGWFNTRDWLKNSEEVAIMPDCIFCKIVRGEIPCAKVYEDDKILAFNDIQPMAPVHVIIIPKKHISTLMDIDSENIDIINNLIAAAQKVAQIKGIDGRGFRTVINCNTEGGQVVFHLHMHLLGGRKLEDKLG
jgi:histidine triad (HIT) family protein